MAKEELLEFEGIVERAAAQCDLPREADRQ